MTAPRWITDDEVRTTIDMAGAIEALESGLRAEAAGRVSTMVKTHVTWGQRSSLHAIGAVAPDWGFAATKTWASTPNGSQARLLMFDSEDGSLRAILAATALGILRTGGITALATRALAQPDADDLAMIGTGKQALSQVAGVHAVRPLRRVRVHGRDRPRADAFAARVTAALGVPATVESTVEDAVRDAPIVTLATRATEPFLLTDMPAKGAHVNAVGAITPDRVEFEPDLLTRCAAVVTDSVAQCRELATELRGFYGTDDDAWAAVSGLARLIAAGAGRPAGADLTLFKSMGTGVADLSLGVRCLARAEAAGR